MTDYFIGSPAIARLLGGSPDDTDVTPDELKVGMNTAFGQLVLFTGKTDWTGTEPNGIGDQAKTIENTFTGAWVRSMWKDPENKSQELFNRAVKMCGQIMDNMKMVTPNQPTDASTTSSAYTYKTNALNQDIPRYKSPRTDI